MKDAVAAITSHLGVRSATSRSLPVIREVVVSLGERS